jgi:hypothetical protein
VGDFVCHNASQFGFRFRFEHHAGIYEQVTAGKGECVHLRAIDPFGRNGHLDIGVAGQVLRDTVHIFGLKGVVYDFGRLLHFLRQLSAERDLLLDGV